MEKIIMKRTVVDIDTRRIVLMLARGRKPHEVSRVPHEAFIRRALKERMGYTSDEPAPDSIKVAAKQLAAPLEAADKAKAEAKANLAKAIAGQLAEKTATVSDTEIESAQA